MRVGSRTGRVRGGMIGGTATGDRIRVTAQENNPTIILDVNTKTFAEVENSTVTLSPPSFRGISPQLTQQFFVKQAGLHPRKFQLKRAAACTRQLWQTKNR